MRLYHTAKFWCSILSNFPLDSGIIFVPFSTSLCSSFPGWNRQSSSIHNHPSRSEHFELVAHQPRSYSSKIWAEKEGAISDSSRDPNIRTYRLIAYHIILVGIQVQQSIHLELIPANGNNANGIIIDYLARLHSVSLLLLLNCNLSTTSQTKPNTRLSIGTRDLFCFLSLLRYFRTNKGY